MDNLEYYDLEKYTANNIGGTAQSTDPNSNINENDLMNSGTAVPAQQSSIKIQPSAADNPPALPPKTKQHHQSEPKPESNVNIPNVNSPHENVSENKVTRLGVKAQSLINLNKPTHGSFNNRTFASRPKLSLETGVLYEERVYTDPLITPTSTYSEVLNRVNKFEKMAVTAPSIQESKPLWAYKDGIRTPTTPPPTAAKLVLNLIKSDSSLSPNFLERQDSSPRFNANCNYNPAMNGGFAEDSNKSAYDRMNGNIPTTTATDNFNDNTGNNNGSAADSNNFRASLTISPKVNRREISLNGLMTQSLINLPRSRDGGEVMPHEAVTTATATMTMSMHAVLSDSRMKEVNGNPSPPYSSHTLATSSPHIRKPKPPPPPIRTTPVTPSSPPPPLPPKNSGHGTLERLPPRPASKELKLDDILQLCEEYERQIESEQRLAQSISFTSTPMPKKTMSTTSSMNNTTQQTNSLIISPLSLAPLSLSPACNGTNGDSCSPSIMADDINLSPVKARHENGQLTPLNCNGLATDLGGPPLSPSCAGVPPLSPASSLTQSRIKTNGSLPRDSKRGPSPSRISLPPTSPKLLEGDVFVWNGSGVASPPPLPPPQSSAANTPASPRTRIKTTVGKSAAVRESYEDASSPTNTLQPGRGSYQDPGARRNPMAVLYSSMNGSFNMDREASYASPSDYQGGREEMYDMEGKSQEELYTEAKELLDMMVNNSSNRSRDDFEKSRLDDSTSSYSRVIIGTGLLGTGYNRNTETNSVLQQLRTERDETILEVSRTASRLKDIEQQMEEANRSLDMETSLLEAELSTNLSKLTDLRNQSAQLRSQESEIESKLSDWRQEAAKQAKLAKAKLTSLESELDQLETEQKAGQGILDTDKELELLEKIKISHEKLEAERRHFEDLEFQQMELEAGLEHDREEVLAALENTEASIREAEEEVGDVEKQQQQISYSQEGQNIQEDYLLVQRQLEEQQDKLSALESKMADILAGNKRQIALIDQQQTVIKRQSDSAADDAIKKINDQLISIRRLSDKLNNVNRLSDQLAAVNRLSDQLTDHMVHDQLMQVNRLSNHIADELMNRKSADSGTTTWTEADTIKTNKTEYNAVKPPTGKWTANLNSAGSGEESTTDSTSDLPQDSSSPSPSPNQRRYRKKSPSPGPNKRLTKRSSMQRASDRRLDLLDGLTSADESIRPVSTDLDIGGVTDASSWVGDCVTMRRGASSRASRPLTRYLPVTTQENFDLRAHIESAGHQIELCSHIILNSCSCRGYLSKLGARLKVWTKRWFVFDRNKRTLVYYNDKSETKVKGGIYFHSISEVYVDHQTNRTTNQKTSFVMKTTDRSYLLMAGSPEAMRIWVDVIFTGAEGYREYQD